MAEPISAELLGIQHPTTDKDRIAAQRAWHGTIDRLIDRDFVQANGGSKNYEDNLELRRAQRQILKRLSPNIVQELQGHLLNEYQYKKRHGKGTSDLDSERGLTKFIKGEIFERLLELEITPEDKSKENAPEVLEQSKEIRDIILDLMQDPSRFGFDNLSSISNPDIFDIVFVDGTYIIKSSTEAKTHFDGRSYSQIMGTGFRSAILLILQEIDKLDNETAEKRGLLPLRMNKDGIKVSIGMSDQYVQYVIVPRDCQYDPDHIGRSRDSENYKITDEQANTFSQELRIMEDQKRLRRSIYSAAEIDAVVKHFLPDIKKILAIPK